MKFGMVLGFGLGALAVYIANSKVKTTMKEQGKQMVKEKIMQIFE